MTPIALIVIVAVSVVGIGVALLINASDALPSAAGGGFFAVPQEYSTGGGQAIKPRWNMSEESAHAPAD